MISFSELKFPDHLSLGATGGPVFTTNINTSVSGYEQRNLISLYPRNRYNIAGALQSLEDFEILIKFFRVHKGRAIGFRFKDWSDYKVSHQLIGIGNSMNKSFQIFKTYEISNMSEVRNINKIVKGTLEVLVDEQKTDAFEIDYDTGVITFNDPIDDRAKVFVSCEFDVPVRFDIDELELDPDSSARRGFEIPLIETKV